MHVLIVYDSKFGNTERLARAIAEQLGSVRLMRAEKAGALERLPPGALKEVPAADFDTRYRMSRLLSGSEAARIASRLKRGGARLVVAPESFFMQRDVPPQGEKPRLERERLEPGEEGHATEWAASILRRMGAACQPGAAR